MNLFHPRTFSTDWEVMVIDRMERCVEETKLRAFAGALRTELGLPVQVDWNTLEFALGVNRSFQELRERVRAVTDRAAQLLREFELELFPSGAHPVEEMFNASHVHVGTIQDESGGIELEHRLVPYVAAFGALAANSPLSMSRRGEYKSYRIRYYAHNNIRPIAPREPSFSQITWGSDAGPKMDGGPTVEVRIVDSVSSRRVLAELATFIAAFVHHQGTRPSNGRLSPGDYQEALTNRWAAARYGMQATFLCGGKPEPVAALLDRMLDDCAAELEALGARRSDLVMVNAMIERRACQADYWLRLAERYPDPWCLASAQAKLAREWDPIDEFLLSAPAMEPQPAVDEDLVLEQHLAGIGEGTHFYGTRRVMSYPPPAADAIVERLVAEGRIVRSVSDRRGMSLSRVE